MLSRSRQIIATNPKAEKVNFDWIEPARQVRIRVDQDEARLLGLSSQALAGVLNTVISGTSVTQVRDDIYLVDVIARATDEQRVSLDYPAHHASAAAGRANGSAQSVCDLRIRAGISLDLAARPRSDPDGASRHRRRSPAGDGRDVAFVRSWKP